MGFLSLPLLSVYFEISAISNEYQAPLEHGHWRGSELWLVDTEHTMIYIHINSTYPLP